MKTPIYHNPENVSAELVDPENEGWRLMLAEEIFERVEATKDIQSWSNIPPKGWSIDIGWRGESKSITYRTKWPLPAEYLVNENQWIAFSDRKPTKEDFPVIAVRVGFHDERPSVYLSLGEYHLLTHWIKAEIPPIPKKEKTQEELDEEAYRNFLENPNPELTSYHIGKEAWFGALKYARGEK